MQVLLIDDHPLLNEGLVSILEATGIFRVSAQATTLAQAMSVIQKAEEMPNIIILDILLGEENGLDFLTMLDNYCKTNKINKPPVLVCSAIADTFKILNALKLGAAGFLSKTSGKEELLKAMDAILCGKVYVADEVTIQLNRKSSMYDKFTKKELDVLNLIKTNKSNKEIANTLSISLRTVENYISKIYFKTCFPAGKRFKKCKAGYKRCFRSFSSPSNMS